MGAMKYKCVCVMYLFVRVRSRLELYDFQLSFQTLTILYQKILQTLQAMPEEAAYRKYTEETTNERLAIVKSVSFLPPAHGVCEGYILGLFVILLTGPSPYIRRGLFIRQGPPYIRKGCLTSGGASYIRPPYIRNHIRWGPPTSGGGGGGCTSGGGYTSGTTSGGAPLYQAGGPTISGTTSGRGPPASGMDGTLLAVTLEVCLVCVGLTF